MEWIYEMNCYNVWLGRFYISSTRGLGDEEVKAVLRGRDFTKDIGRSRRGFLNSHLSNSHCRPSLTTITGTFTQELDNLFCQ